MSRVLRSLLYAALLSGLPAFGQSDRVYLGDGHSGPLVVTTGSVQINLARPLLNDVAAGATDLSLSSTTGFSAGDLVLLLQTITDSTDVPPTSRQTTVLSSQRLGRWELVRVRALNGSILQLQSAVTQAFSIVGAQVIRVPEYTTVDIAAGAALVAPTWDGQSGGVLAFLSRGTVSNEGTLKAVGAGFRGGVSDLDRTGGCSNPNEPFPAGAGKGENVLGQWGSSFSGFGSSLNGGGGGVCLNAGGGGGGNGGAGGRGANADPNDPSQHIGGQGGSVISASPLRFLLLGGGGGAGHRDETPTSNGGSGGGAVFVRAGALQGTGIIDVSGEAAPNTDNSGFGSGGGGAGGSVLLQLRDVSSCGQIRAVGGTGGSSAYPSAVVGPGGGGGAGNIFFQAPVGSTCTREIAPGLAGTVAGSFSGATPTTADDPGFAGQETVVTSGYLADGMEGPGTDLAPILVRVGCGCGATAPFDPTTGLGLIYFGLRALQAKQRRFRTRTPAAQLELRAHEGSRTHRANP